MKTTIREYGDGLTVEIREYGNANRWVIQACNDAGFNHTAVDLLDTLEWVKKNLPDIFKNVIDKK